MSNALYAKSREAALKSIWTGTFPPTGTIRVFLLDAASYTPNLTTDQFFSDIPTGARVGASGATTRGSGFALTSKTTTAGVADAIDATLATVPAGPALEYICIILDDGVADASSPVLALIDTATGIPVTPGGGDVQIVWDNGANKIFML